MTSNQIRNATLSALTALALSGCATGVSYVSRSDNATRSAACRAALRIGRFSPSTDLLIANFDNKPDADDIYSIAGLTTMLRDQRLACVRVVATTGAYAARNPEPFIHADTLMTMAFGTNWADADSDRAGATKFLAGHAIATLRTGGDVWIMEAGMSDLSANAVRRMAEMAPKIDLRKRVHLVQHSAINEMLASAEALKYVREHTDYIKIADGNVRGNGTPGFKTESPAAWPVLLASPRAGDVWSEARRLADAANPVSSHPNKVIGDGGFDFSDLVEGTYIFGFEGLPGVEEFAAAFTAGAEK